MLCTFYGEQYARLWVVWKSTQRMLRHFLAILMSSLRNGGFVIFIFFFIIIVVIYLYATKDNYGDL